ncbi:MAG: hypothetical protein ACP5JV_08595 [Thermus sp.]|uniref:hypothetical protein n=1 Tax=Thermus sp. TaxID=275 RepID=UPI003D12772C
MDRVDGVRVKPHGDLGVLRDLLEAAEALEAAGFVVRVRGQIDATALPNARPEEVLERLEGLEAFGEGLEVEVQTWREI